MSITKEELEKYRETIKSLQKLSDVIDKIIRAKESEAK
jgi:hypothetical protein